MPFPAVAILHPIVSLAIRVQHQGTSNSRVMEVEMRNVARRKNQDVAWPQCDDKSQFMQTYLPPFPLSERQHQANSLVVDVTVASGGNADVDDDARKWKSRGVGVQGKHFAI